MCCSVGSAGLEVEGSVSVLQQVNGGNDKGNESEAGLCQSVAWNIIHS